MEIRLTFREKEVRDLYYESFEVQEQETEKRIKERHRTTIVFMSITLFFFALTFFHTDWVYYGLFFFLITLLFTGWTVLLKQREEDKITEQKNSVDKFLARYEAIDNIKYIYDQHKIRYFEADTLNIETDWCDIISVVKNEKWIYVSFKNPQQNIWIPRVTVEEQEIILFEQTLEERLQHYNIARANIL